MRRREFIALFGTIAIWPLKADAQQRLRTIAIVGHTAAGYGPWAAALVERLNWSTGRLTSLSRMKAPPSQ